MNKENKKNYCVDCKFLMVDSGCWCMSPDLRDPVTFSPVLCRHLRYDSPCPCFEATDEEQRAKNLAAVSGMQKNIKKTSEPDCEVSNA